jgi:hypothetical protein
LSGDVIRTRALSLEADTGFSFNSASVAARVDFYFLKKYLTSYSWRLRRHSFKSERF